MKYFKGDTLSFNYFCLNEKDEKINFNGSTVIAVIYESANKNLYKMKEFKTGEQTDLKIVFTAEEMKAIESKQYVIEVKLVNDEIKTTLHEALLVYESWCLDGR